MSGESGAELGRDAIGLREELMRRHPGRRADTSRAHLAEPAPTDPAQNGATHR
ncbi:hypothetical protein [Streptomyces sp. MBT33]|uniref:hypothetical protein n=1 Tax=Streptomyces sp. MBT33 TaxID=1488363 RepID=UPI00190B7505|nr:hypothetical protein [Streptomyces sp. MBT33]MBK3640776.1 hypothetical protein [Streptomyces sp. MBT33]